MLTMCISSYAANAAEEAVAVYNSTTPVLTNITSAKSPSGMLSETEIGGVPAVTLKKATYSSVVLDIDKSFARRVTDGSGFDVTVSYYDGAQANFKLVYDAIDTSVSSTETEIVETKNTGQWKTHTFHLYDAYFGNRISNGDIALVLYTESMRISPNDLIFNEIKITKTGKRFPFTLTENVTRNGNFYYKGETPEISLTAENNSDADAEMKYKITVTSNGKTVGEKTGECTLKAGTDDISIPTGITACGVYDAKIELYDDADLYGEYNTSFSISVPAEQNSLFGVNTHFTQNVGKTESSLTYRDPVKTIPTAKAMGSSMIRQCYYWNQYVSNGNKMPEEWTSSIDEAKKNGVDTLILLAGGSSKYDDGGFPKSATALKAWGEYVYDVVSSLKGKADTFQIWNEYHHTANNTQSEAVYYTELLKVSYQQAKKANPDCTVIGMAGLPGVWAHWVDWMLDAGAGPYMDAMSCHEYDQYRKPEAYMMSWMNDIKTKLANHGYGNLPIWVTETGWSTNSVSHRNQASYSVRQYVMYQEAGITKYMLYDFQNDGAVEHDQEMSFGSTYSAYEDEHLPNSAKELYVALSNMNNKIGNEQIELNQNHDNSYLYKYTNGTWVVWNSAGESEETVDVGVDSVMLCDMFGNTQNASTQNGKITVKASEEPMYIIPGYFTVDEINYSEGTITVTVDNISKGKSPTVMVLKPGKKVEDIYTDKTAALAYIGQADGKTSFTFTFKADAEGTYNIYLNSGNELVNVGTAFNYPRETAVSLSQNGKDITKISDLSAEGDLTAKAVITDAYSSADYIFICGLYENGVMKNAKTGKEPVKVSEDSKEITIDISADSLKNIDEIKLYLWKDKTLMVPVRNVYGIE